MLICKMTYKHTKHSMVTGRYACNENKSKSLKTVFAYQNENNKNNEVIH